MNCKDCISFYNGDIGCYKGKVANPHECENFKKSMYGKSLSGCENYKPKLTTCENCENFKTKPQFHPDKTVEWLETCQNYKPKQHPLDELKGQILDFQGSYGSAEYEKLVERLRYESIKHGIAMAIARRTLKDEGHEDWIVED